MVSGGRYDDLAGHQHGALPDPPEQERDALSAPVAQTALRQGDAGTDGALWSAVRRAELGHRSGERHFAEQYQLFRQAGHGRIRRVFQAGGLCFPADHELYDGSDYLHRPESRSDAV